MPPLSTRPETRHRADRCPGVLRPWVAEDGALLRIRLVGGVLRRDQLAGLACLSAEYGDGALHVTARANVQVRGVPLPVPDGLVERVLSLGLLPSPAHDRVRNIMVSPLTGRSGGRADLRPVARALDEALRGDPMLAALPARFLFCLDDRGDLCDRTSDLAAVAVAPDRARLWAGGRAGEVVDLAQVPGRLMDLAHRFLAVRGSGPTGWWHVSELPGGGTDLGPFRPADPPPRAPAPPYGSLVQDDGRHTRHLAVPDGVLSPALLDRVLACAADEVVVTPWRSVLLPDLAAAS